MAGWRGNRSYCLIGVHFHFGVIKIVEMMLVMVTQYRGGQKWVYSCEYMKHRVYSCTIIYLFIYLFIYCIFHTNNSKLSFAHLGIVSVLNATNSTLKIIKMAYVIFCVF